MRVRTLILHLLAAAILAGTAPALAAAQSLHGGRSSKVDRALGRAVLESRDPQRVIIRTTRGSRSAIRRALELHGDLVNDGVGDDGTLTATVHADDVAALAESQSVLSVSIDAVVSPSRVRRGNRGRGSDRWDERRAGREAAAADRRARRQSRRAERRARWEARKDGGDATADDGTTTDDGTGDGASTGDITTQSDAKTRNMNAAKASGEELRDVLGLGTDGPTGAGVVVAVIDSGIAPLDDFGDRIVASVDCRQPECVLSEPSDEYGHGTHVAGLIAGTRTGVAPGARLIAVKVLDASGQGLTSDVIKALTWVEANRPVYGIEAVNLSLGHPIYEPAETDPLVIAVQKTVRAGVKVVVAAGNFGTNPDTGEVGYGGITSPGNAPNAITVGATKIVKSATKKVADYSSRGPTWYDGFLKPDLVAPGDSLLGPLPPDSTLRGMFVEKGGGHEEAYVALSGTSMATGVTVGAIATVLGAAMPVDGAAPTGGGRSGVSSNLLKAILQYTAIPVYEELDSGEQSLYDPLTQGSGAINAGGAVAVVQSIDRSVPAPGYWLTSWQAADDFGQTTIGNKTYTWTQTIFWGDNIVWGSSLLTNAQWAWQDNIVWGSAWEDNIVWGSDWSWGDNIVWGSGWGDNIVWGSLFGGDNIVWGSNVLLDNVVWGSSFGFDNIVWGSSWGDNIVWGSNWGDNIVWGSSFAWGDNIVWGSNLLAATIDGVTVDSSDWGDNIVWGSEHDDEGQGS